MKKRIVLALIISALLTSSATVYAGNETESTDTTPKYVLGDVDSNGKITSTDYLKLKSHFWGSENLKGTAFAMADVNFDGELTVSDYAKIKDSMLGEYALDDSSWAEYEGKAEVVGTGEFDVQFSAGGECPSIFEYVESSDMISESIIHYPDYPIYGYHGEVKEKITFINHKGEEKVLDHVLSNATSAGELTFWYEDDCFNNYYFNIDGELVGVSLSGLFGSDAAFENFGTDEKITDEEAISIGLKNAQKLWEGKTFASGGITLTTSFGYRLNYPRYVNGIKTTDYAEIWLTPCGELRGYFYHDTAIKDYDLRSFNVNDDISLYSENLIQIGKELLANDEFIKDYFDKTREELPEIEITIDEPRYGIGADGKLAGFTSINFNYTEAGYARKEFVGFHALEKE